MPLPLRPTLAVAALCASALLSTAAHAQRTRDDGRTVRPSRTIRFSVERRDRAPDRDITMSVGVLRSDDDNESLPMAALRTDWRVRRWLRSEFGVSYAVGTTERREGVTPPLPSSSSIAIPVSAGSLMIGSATIGLRAELPARVLRPYVGVAGGLTYRDEEYGQRYVRTTVAFPTGIRLVLSDRLSLRGEARWRFDQRRIGGEAVRVEQTAGLSVAF